MEVAPKNKYNISIESEREYWLKNILNDWIKYNTKCSNCKKYSLKLKKIKSVANPFKLQCSNYKCRKIYNLRNNTIFSYFSKTPMSILITALDLFICEDFNATKSIKYIQEKYNLNSLGQKNIYNYFILIRKCLAQYYKDKYEYEKLAYTNELKNIAVDESLFVKDINGVQYWIIGLINVETKEIRLEIVTERSEEIIKKIILHHIGSGNNIITDGWPSYNWLSSFNYNHIRHIHGRNDFGHGLESTSHIEQIWEQLKLLIVRLYVELQSDNLIYFVREIEFRYYIKNKSKYEKLKGINEISYYCSNTCNFNFYEKPYLIDIDKDNYVEVDEDEESEDD